MSAPKKTLARAPMRPLDWVICAIASIGFAFDVFAILVLQLVVRPALSELGRLIPGMPAYAHWTGILFWVPAAGAGVFGLAAGFFLPEPGPKLLD